MDRTPGPPPATPEHGLGHALGLSALLALGAVLMNVAGHDPWAMLPQVLGQQLQWLVVQLAAASVVTTPLAWAFLRQRRLLAQLRESEARYRLLADHSTDIIMTTAPDGTIHYVSPAVRQHLGCEPAALVGQSGASLVVAADQPLIRTAYRAALARPGEVECVEFRARQASGAERWFETTLRAVPGPGGTIDCVVSMIRDIAERKAVEVALAEAALTDPLTGLANRRHFEAELERAIVAGREGCLALVDLDHFKRVNDRFGHAAGDAVLKTFARVARAELRASDLVARIGGEEFALLLPGAGLDVAEMVCGRLGAALSRTATQHDNISIVITSSIGLTPITTSAMHSMEAADRALYEAKAAGRDCLSVAA
ncbi:MAG: GGDEF domain-containing protein [Proteobacteria bacterium]|nr:GGDEF domain-containing protein [Pseudomonadota bacterium]